MEMTPPLATTSFVGLLLSYFWNEGQDGEHATEVRNEPQYCTGTERPAAIVGQFSHSHAYANEYDPEFMNLSSGQAEQDERVAKAAVAERFPSSLDGDKLLVSSITPLPHD